MWDLALGLGVAPMPSRGSLAVLRSLGFTALINVSGSRSAHIYSSADLSGLAAYDYPFPDVLTVGVDAQTALDRLGADGLASIAAAVARLISLMQQHSRVLVFCHLGVGRSPLVAAMALSEVKGMSRACACASIRRLRPTAQFTEISMVVWDRVLAHLSEHGAQP